MSGCVLIGPQGVGKSTCGLRLASRLGLPFVDTDWLVEERCGRPHRLFWREAGEEAYRILEREVIADLQGAAVVATGGGAFLHSRGVLEALAPCIYLYARWEALCARFPNASHAVYVAREPIYEEMASYTVDTSDLDPDQVAAQLEAWYGQQ